MNASRLWKSSVKWIGAAAIALLLASITLYGQNEKKRGERGTPPARGGGSSRETHQASPPANPPARPAAPAAQPAVRQPSVQSAPAPARPAAPAAQPNVRQPSVQSAPPPAQSGGAGGQGRRFGQNAESPARQGGQGRQGGQTGAPPPNFGQPGGQTRQTVQSQPAGTPTSPSQPGNQGRQGGTFGQGGQGRQGGQGQQGGSTFGQGGQGRQGGQGQQGGTVGQQGQGRQGGQGQQGGSTFGQGGQGRQGGQGQQGSTFGQGGQGRQGGQGQQGGSTFGQGGQGRQGGQGQQGGTFGKGGQGRQGGQGQQGGAFSQGGGRQGDSGRRGPEVVRTRSGGEIHRGAGGFVREVRTPSGAIIHHAPDGIRRVEVAKSGGRVVVATGRGRGGYVQRPLIVRNTTYIQRTYISHGVSYARVYRPRTWGHVSFNVYTPVRYYRPAFYSWAWTPWARPVYYRWGWVGNPWYRYYGGWFTPYPYYTSPMLWLTDYLIANTLEQAYQERMDAGPVAAVNPAYSGGQVALTPEVKQAVADEVHRQLEQARAEQGAPGASQMFSPNGSNIFVVSTPIQVDDGVMGCALTEGDVLQMNGAPPPDATFASVAVLASKGQDCRKGSRVQVALNDLVEMQNQMRATLDQGLNDLQSRQGQEGLPALPAGVTGFTNASFASDVRPDTDVASELNLAAQDSDRLEQDVVNQAADSAGGSVRIAQGMTIPEIEQALGKPTSIADLGQKKIYVYKDMKITFIDGRVADVQ